MSQCLTIEPMQRQRLQIAKDKQKNIANDNHILLASMIFLSEQKRKSIIGIVLGNIFLVSFCFLQGKSNQVCETRLSDVGFVYPLARSLVGNSQAL